MTLREAFPGASALVQGPFRGSLILIGPPGSGKSIFCKQFLCGLLEAGDHGVYASTGENAGKVEEGMALLGFNTARFRSSGLLHIIDLHSIPSEKRREKQLGISGWLKGPHGTHYALEVERAMEDAVVDLAKPGVVLDSLGTMLLHSSEAELLQLVESLLARLKLSGAFPLFSLASGNYSDQFSNTVRSLFDGVLEMKVDESSGSMRRLLRVFSLKGTPHKSDWLSFSIANEGLAMEEPLETRCALCSKPVGSQPIKYEMSGQTVYFDNRECFANYRKLKSVYGDAFL